MHEEVACCALVHLSMSLESSYMCVHTVLLQVNEMRSDAQTVTNQSSVHLGDVVRGTAFWQTEFQTDGLNWWVYLGQIQTDSSAPETAPGVLLPSPLVVGKRSPSFRLWCAELSVCRRLSEPKTRSCPTSGIPLCEDQSKSQTVCPICSLMAPRLQRLPS